jgi:Outer membrane protein beta-barrel domain
MKIVCLIFAISCLVPIFAGAENPNGNLEITVLSGFSFLDANVEVPTCPFCESVSRITFSQENSIKGSFVVGFKAGYYLNPAMEVEGSFVIAPDHELTQTNTFFCPPGVICPLINQTPLFIPFFLRQSNVVTYQYDGNFVYNFAKNDLRPFVTFGIGGMTSVLSPGSRTDFAINFGGGAKFYFNKIGIRAEINDHVVPDYFLTGNTEHDLQVQYGFIFRLP